MLNTSLNEPTRYPIAATSAIVNDAQETNASNNYRWLNRQLAEQNAVQCLLNCYLREYALRNHQVVFDAQLQGAPQVLTHGVGRLVHIRLDADHQLLIRADQIGLLGRCRFVSAPYLKKNSGGWHRLTALELSHFLLHQLSLTLAVQYNRELFEQIQNSVQVCEAFLNRRACKQPPADTFVRAEQSLLWGHAFHPAPKSRHGISMDDMLACSPEIYTRFALYWFRVQPQLIEQKGNVPDAMGLFTTLHGQADCLYPCHPWEAQHILRQPLARAAIKEGLITPLGCLGAALAPTSSVRTLYHPDLPLQLKFSIHVRLTNCVRKNAWYELESAVALTDLLRPLQRKLRQLLPHFSCLLEPAASTLNLQAFADQHGLDGARELRESFGILYRENFSQQPQPKGAAVEVAASLFAYDDSGESIMAARLQHIAHTSHQRYNTVALKWLNRYAQILLPGILHYAFIEGVIFEPHLQNVLISSTDLLPSHVWIRDLEGTKLLAEHWPESRLKTVSERARKSVHYERAQGWQRIAYCALVNNLSEAIFHSANGNGELERQLWQAVAKILAHWQERNGDQPEVTALLAGAPLPCKTNFTTRLLQQADRQSAYADLQNPFQLSANEHCQAEATE